MHLLTLAPSLGPTEAAPQAADGGIMGNLSGASNPENVAEKETLNSDIKYSRKSFWLKPNSCCCWYSSYLSPPGLMLLYMFYSCSCLCPAR